MSRPTYLTLNLCFSLLYRFVGSKSIEWEKASCHLALNPFIVGQEQLYMSLCVDNSLIYSLKLIVEMTAVGDTQKLVLLKNEFYWAREEWLHPNHTGLKSLQQ